MTCNNDLRLAEKAYPRTCAECGLGPCKQVPLNALGKPSPGRTDFKSWTREGLEQFARMAADENLVLREDNKVLLQQWRELVKEVERGRIPEQH